jgi:LPS sulfotransferase NodH
MSPVLIREEQRKAPFSFVMRMIGTDTRPWVGFKLLYNHCRERNRESFWDLVQQDNAWYIVHLTRSSILDLYVSLLKARETGEWSQPAGSRLSDRCHEEPWAISLSPEKTVRFIELYERWKAQAQALTRSHKSIDITYEALAHDPKATSNRILEYFEQPPLDHYVLSYCKQATRPLAETVSNYRQLQSALKATKWAYLVER